MLGLMRRHSRSLFIKLIYVGLILSFVIWGIGSYSSRDNLIAVKVNGEGISIQAYQRSFDDLINYYKETLKDNFNDEMIVAMNLKKLAMDRLIERSLLLEEADSLHIKATKEEVQARIRSYPAFQKNGSFDKETYFRILEYNKIKPGDFEDEQKEFIRIAKAESIIRNNATVSDDEIMAAYMEAKTTVSLEYIKISPEKFEKKAKPNTAEIKEYFAANMGEFTIPEMINIGYSVFTPEDFTKEIKLTSEDYEDYYKSYIDDFTIPAKVKARHILVKFGENREEARIKAEELLARVNNGEDFAMLAADHSEDAASASKGGDLGFFGRGDMVKPFEDAAFSMKKGETSPLIESIYGFHIINITDIAEEKVKPLATVKSKIKAIMETEMSRELAEGRAEDIYYEALKGKKLEELVKEEGLTYKTTGLLVMSEVPEALEEIKDLLLASTTEETGWVSRPTETGGKIYILTLLEKKGPREPKFEEVKEKVRMAATRNKAKSIASALGEKILKDAMGGATLKQLSRKNGLKLEVTDHFSRSNNMIPGIGLSQEIVLSAFELSSEAPLPSKTYKVGDDIFIIRFREKKEADAEAFEKEKDLFKSKLLEQRREEVYRRWLQDTKKRADLVYHEDYKDLDG
ncbi:MAG: SurA N-terminal domain-containing protein [bacterium]|nr:SurA N-terminal domain-containing protein [bacterium]